MGSPVVTRVKVEAIRWTIAICIGIVSGVVSAQRNLTVSSAPIAQRVALVIGNDSYAKVKRLENARADARAMAQGLERAGFNVTLQLDLDDRAMREALRNFKARLSGGSEAVFYFAGHGVQLGAANYVLPINITADNEEQVKDDGVSLQRVLDDLTEQKTRFSLVIIDACRDNPFPRVAGRSIGTSRGLTPTTAATGQMVLYSAGAGQMALDRLNEADRNPNGLFTRVFLQEMQKPGVPVDRVLRNVRDQVVAMAKSVGHEQVPALYDQAIGEFYFRPPLPGGAPVANASQAPALDPAAGERVFWDSIKDSNSPEEFKAYLDRFPSGLFAALAQSRFRALRSGIDVRPTTPASPPSRPLPPSRSSPYLDPTAINDGTNWTAVAASGDKSALQVIIPALPQPVALGLFKPAFFSDGLFTQTMMGDVAALKRMNLPDSVARVVLIEADPPQAAKQPDAEGLVQAYQTIRLTVIDARGSRVLAHEEFQVRGVGFVMAVAMERLKQGVGKKAREYLVLR